MVCTDDGNLTLENGNVLKTGNNPQFLYHPLEMMRGKGFTTESFVFATVSGKPPVLEDWYMKQLPSAGGNLNDEFCELGNSAFGPTDLSKTGMNADELKTYLKNCGIRRPADEPLKLSDVPLDALGTEYVGIFIPGGHGALVNLPESEALGKILHKARELTLPVATGGHGVAALLSTTKVSGKGFAYKDYCITCFPGEFEKTEAVKIGVAPGVPKLITQDALTEAGAVYLDKPFSFHKTDWFKFPPPLTALDHKCMDGEFEVRRFKCCCDLITVADASSVGTLGRSAADRFAAFANRGDAKEWFHPPKTAI